MNRNAPRKSVEPGSLPPHLYRLWNSGIVQPPPERITSAALTELLLVKCSDDGVSAKAAFLTIANAAFLTIANACKHLQLANGQRVQTDTQFQKFFEEMAARVREAA